MNDFFILLGVGFVVFILFVVGECGENGYDKTYQLIHGKLPDKCECPGE